MESTWSLYGVQMESIWSPDGVYMESRWSLYGVHNTIIKICTVLCLVWTPCGLHVDSMWTLVESIWSYGVHMESMGQSKVHDKSPKTLHS
jgi:hypothetical protein